MTYAIFFKELSKLLHIPSLQYIFSFLKLFSKQSAVYLKSLEKTHWYTIFKSIQETAGKLKFKV